MSLPIVCIHRRNGVAVKHGTTKAASICDGGAKSDCIYMLGLEHTSRGYSARSRSGGAGGGHLYESPAEVVPYLYLQKPAAKVQVCMV